MKAIHKVISAVLSISAICSAAPVSAETSTPLPYVLKTIFMGSPGDPGDSVFVYDVNGSVQIVGTGALGAFTEKGDDLERFTLSQCPNCQIIGLHLNEAGDVAGNVLLTPSQFAGFYHNGPHNRLIKGPAGTPYFVPQRTEQPRRDHGKLFGCEREIQSVPRTVRQIHQLFRSVSRCDVSVRQ